MNCKICNKEITTPKRWVYCSDECANEGKKIEYDILRATKRQEYINSKAKWKHSIIKIGKIKHNKTVPVNKLGLTNSVSTYLKLLLREYDLTVKENIKMIRCDGIEKDFLVVVVTPTMIKTLFEKRYKIYKDNFRLDCLRTVKILSNIFEKVNEYDFKNAKNIN